MDQASLSALLSLHGDLTESLKRLKDRRYFCVARSMIVDVRTLESNGRPGVAENLIGPTLELLEETALGLDPKQAADQLLQHWNGVLRRNPLAFNYSEIACRLLTQEMAEGTSGRFADRVVDAVWEYDESHPENELGSLLRKYISSLAN